MRRRKLWLTVIAGFLLLAPMSLSAQGANIQGQHGVRVKIPSVLRLEISAAEVLFDLREAEYPRRESYPVYFTPTSGGEYRSVFVCSNLREEWRLKINGVSEEIPITNIEWSLDKVNWSPLSTDEQLLVSGEHTGGWQEFRVYYRLLVTGEEFASDEYNIRVNYELSAL